MHEATAWYQMWIRAGFDKLGFGDEITSFVPSWSAAWLERGEGSLELYFHQQNNNAQRDSRLPSLKAEKMRLFLFLFPSLHYFFLWHGRE